MGADSSRDSTLAWAKLGEQECSSQELNRHHKDFWENNFYWLLQAWGLKKVKLKDNSPVHKSVRADWSTELSLVKLRLSNFTPQAHQWATENTLRGKLSKVQKAPGLPSVKTALQSRFSCPAQVGETLHSQGLRNVFAQANKSFISLQTTGKQSN